MSTVHPRLTHARHLRGANGCEARGDEYVMRPIHADVMDVVLAVAQQRDTVDDGTRIGGKRSLGRLARRGSADDCALTLTPVRWDLTDLLSGGRPVHVLRRGSLVDSHLLPCRGRQCETRR